MNGWEKDKQASDIFIPEIKQILGLYLIGEANREEDQERNTDLIVLKMETIRIACRVRDKKYMDKYSNEFTIRCRRPSGTKTELKKIIEGWGNYFFYGFGCKDSGELIMWKLADLNVFRLAYNRFLFKGKKYTEIQNHDESSSFMAFPWSDFPENLVFCSYDKHQHGISEVCKNIK